MSDTRPEPENGWERHECGHCHASQGACHAMPLSGLRVRCCDQCDHHADCRARAAQPLLEAADAIHNEQPGLANWLRMKAREVSER